MRRSKHGGVLLSRARRPTMTEVPDCLEEFMRALRDQHGASTIIDEDASERHFGNQYADYRVQGLTVRLLRDRHIWEVLCNSGTHRWYDIPFVSDLLGIGDEHDSMSLESQAQFVLNHMTGLLELTDAPSAWQGASHAVYQRRLDRAGSGP